MSIIGMSDDGFMPWNEITVKNAQGSPPLSTLNAATVQDISIETLVALIGAVIIINSHFIRT